MKAALSFGAASAAPTTVQRRRWLVLGASVLLAACASKPVTETTETSTATAQQLVASDVDVVCKDMQVTGSHFPKRVCKSKKEWGQIEDASRSFTQGVQADGTKNLAPIPQNGVINPTPIGGAPVY
jgi:uncharacterized lipoprotein YajG